MDLVSDTITEIKDTELMEGRSEEYFPMKNPHKCWHNFWWNFLLRTLTKVDTIFDKSHIFLTKNQSMKKSGCKSWGACSGLCIRRLKLWSSGPLFIIVCGLWILSYVVLGADVLTKTDNAGECASKERLSCLCDISRTAVPTLQLA